MSLSHLYRAALVLLLAVTVAGCSSTRKMLDLDTAVALTIQTSPDLNPDQDDRPSPVVIKVFALADDRQFRREDFLSLYENPPERLGSDLLQTFELQEFSPDESRTETLKLTPETRFIGLMAEYVQYDLAKALLVLPITANKTVEYTVKADRLRIIQVD